MTMFKSPIVLGKKYKDERTGIEGHATGICFQQHGCVEIVLEHMKDGELKTTLFNELRLNNSSAEQLIYDNYYESDLVLGNEYEDIETGIKGHLSVVEFHENMSTRGIIRSATKNKKEVTGYKYHSIDDFLLRDLATKKVAERKDDKRSPASHETTRYDR